MNGSHVSVAQVAANPFNPSRIGRLAVLLAGALLVWDVPVPVVTPVATQAAA